MLVYDGKNQEESGRTFSNQHSLLKGIHFCELRSFRLMRRMLDLNWGQMWRKESGRWVDYANAGYI